MWVIAPLKIIQGHRFTDFGTSGKPIYDFLLVINTNLPHILHHFQDIAFDRSKIAIFVVTRVCVCLSAAACPHLHGPGCNLGEW